MGYSHDRRDDMATPLCGAHRPNKTNPLLQKPLLGCVKPTVYDLPSKNNLQHEYGLTQLRDGSSSAETVGNWHSSEPNEKIQPGRDFRKLNKQAAMQGICTNKQVQEFRQTNDARLSIGSVKVPEKKPYDDSTRFGRATISSTSFNDTINHAYRYDWVSQAPPAAEVNKSKAQKKPQQTKSSMLLRESNLQKPTAEGGPVWKMSKFQNVPARLGTQG